MLPYINAPFDYVASILGASTDELKLITSFLLSYPLAAVLKRLPDSQPALKNAFNISIGLFYLVGLFDLWHGLFIVTLDAAVIYAIAAYIRGPWMPWLGFVYLMGHMSVSHIYRQIEDNTSAVDITGAQMVMVMKLSAFCWNVFDGRQPSRDLNADQKERMLSALPNVLDYAGFVAFFPSLMVGPAFDYVDYHRWLNTSMFDLPPGTDPAKAPPTRGKQRIPRSATPAMWKMVTGLGWVLLFMQLSPYYNPDVVLSRGFLAYGFPRRVWHVYMMSFVARMKYYGVWTLTEGACILSGIGYKGFDPKTGRPDWSRLTNIKPAGVELAQNSHAYLGNWNCNTNHWLRNYVYLRVTPRGKKPGFRASLATFVTSAFWHGFAPGYYMAFILASFIQNVAKNARRLIRPFFLTPDGSKPLPSKRYYDLATWLTTQLFFSFTTAPFILLTLDASLTCWARVYFFAIIGVAAGNLALLTPGKAYLQRSLKARQGGSTRPGVERAESKETVNMEAAAGGTLGVPSEPGKEFDEMVDEVLEEVRKRRERGEGVGFKVPTDGMELRRRVEGTLREKITGEKVRGAKGVEET